MGLERMKKCCFCWNLTQGSLISALYTALVCLVFIGISGEKLGSYHSRWRFPHVHIGFYTAVLCLSIVMLVGCVMLANGVSRKSKYFLIPWILFEPIWTVLALCAAVVLPSLYPTEVGNPEDLTPSIVGVVFMCLLNIYALICVCFFYWELSKEPANAKNMAPLASVLVGGFKDADTLIRKSFRRSKKWGRNQARRISMRKPRNWMKKEGEGANADGTPNSRTPRNRTPRSMNGPSRPPGSATRDEVVANGVAARSPPADSYAPPSYTDVSRQNMRPERGNQIVMSPANLDVRYSRSPAEPRDQYGGYNAASAQPQSRGYYGDQRSPASPNAYQGLQRPPQETDPRMRDQYASLSGTQSYQNRDSYEPRGYRSPQGQGQTPRGYDTPSSGGSRGAPRDYSRGSGSAPYYQRPYDSRTPRSDDRAALHAPRQATDSRRRLYEDEDDGGFVNTAYTPDTPSKNFAETYI
ncbi:uncharacterized protein LOC112041228 [Lingula anatina]|uniref:Uncharacterized protein LOC112041228 n=1 Tax=Lingula anatina TaxID=7574 RepID=A0A2R2MMJ3_LINAN|nr:uncharacterized protein LOC112041228 [Lingula anatina]|eukprot:XP_023931436.1 uncharacterized protein LOC112041228 [Lingula anatina]